MSLVGRKLGPYEVLDHLGHGGMAIVYRARHTHLDREVALKVLPEECSRDPELLTRFRRESRILAGLRHPGIIEVFDCDSIDGVNFFTMALQVDPTLETVLQDHQRLDEGRASRVLDSMLEALAAVHAKGILHRDVKPGNVFITSDDEVVLADFGVARPAFGHTALTVTGTVLGTMLYISPEQIDGHPADARSDLYAAGLVLYYAVAGQLPFPDRLVDIVREKTLSAELKSPRLIVPAISPAMEGLILRACARRPEDRFQSAQEFREALIHLPGGPGQQVVHRRTTSPRCRVLNGAGPDRRVSSRLATLGSILRAGVGMRLAAATGLVLLGFMMARWMTGDELLHARIREPAPGGVAPSPQTPARTSPRVASGEPPARAQAVHDELWSALDTMRVLWPGYEPTPLDRDAARLTRQASAGHPGAADELSKLEHRFLATLPSRAVQELIAAGLILTFASPVRDPGSATRNPPGADLLGNRALLWRWWLESNVAVLREIKRSRVGEARPRGVVLRDVRMFAGYLFLTQPGLYDAVGTRVLALVQRSAAIQDATMWNVRKADPGRVVAAVTGLDRVLLEHFRSRRMPGSGG